ncbi:MAG TPA: hypothetical protein PLZ36_04250, partial [Armatimonadota bacterium]|nr:hypothetical protein [Armatimonadota bacterium]
AGQAAQREIVLAEQLNVNWQHELVTYPFTAENGACVAESVRLTGPAGPVPVQLANIAYWPDTKFVQSATLAFVVEALAPRTTNTYQVTFGPAAATDAMPAPDLTVTATDAQVEAATSRFGARLLLGRHTYDPPVPAKEVPAPVLGMRRANGAWFGGSRLYGETPVTALTATLTDRGPAFVRVAYRYTYADGNTLDLTAQLHAQGNQLYFETLSAKDNRGKDGFDILLTPGLPPLLFQFMPEVQQVQVGASEIGKTGWKEKAVAAYPAGTITNLAPWGDWWNEFTQTKFYLRYTIARAEAVPGEELTIPPDDPEKAELVIARQDAGAWVKPGERGEKHIPLIKGADNTLYLRVTNALGERKWSIGENPSWEAKLARVFRPINTFQDEVDPLNVVKDMVLDWPASAEKHPRLILSAEEIAKAAVENPAAVKQNQDVARLRQLLGQLAYYDTMRNAANAICLYDGIIDSDLITPEERKLFRAQMAFLAYRLASPANWSAERWGYASGNPNMTVAHVLNQGLAACTLRDHPMAKAWVEKPQTYMEAWMNRLDAKGYWNESGHYGRVSVSKLMLFAIALQRAGFTDYFQDQRLKNMALFYEKSLTPPDPQKVLSSSPRNETKLGRLSPPIGRGSHGSNWGLGGLMAKGFLTSDPALSQVLQWSFQQTNYSQLLGEGMSGLDILYTDRTLPASAPTDWTSEFMPSVGPLLRSGVGSPDENYLWFVTQAPTNPDGQFWASEIGTLLAWWAKGRPISRRFPSVPDMNHDHGLLCNRVMLATNWKAGQKVSGGYSATAEQQGFAAFPRMNAFGAEFTWKGNWMQVVTPSAVPDFPAVPKVGQLPPANQPPARWRRQGLWVYDDADPGGVQYLILRDTVTGGQPTQWQFWTTSEKIGTPEEAADRAAFLADKPGATSAPARELHGDRFTAPGQLGVDVEYYIAAPADTPRHTLRYATRSSGYWVRDFTQAQDLLHLQLPGDGAYFVALFPRTAEEAAPTFTTLGEGTVIKIAGDFGTDYAFLAAAETRTTAEQAAFSGTSGSVQVRPGRLLLALGAPGTVRYGTAGLTAPMPATLTAGATQLILRCAPDHPGGQVTITAASPWQLAKGQRATMTVQGTQYQLTLPAGVTQVTLEKPPARPAR